MNRRSDQAIRSVAFVLLSLSMLWAEAGTLLSKRHCLSGAAAANKADFSRALAEWRLLTSDSSQKDWVRVVDQCLKMTGLAKDDKDVASWFEKAVAKDVNDARVLLGVLYATGVGVNRDLARAKELFTGAARKGSEAAELLLQKVWHRPGIPDTFDRWDDDIGGVEWKGSDTALSSSARR